MFSNAEKTRSDLYGNGIMVSIGEKQEIQVESKEKVPWLQHSTHEEGQPPGGEGECRARPHPATPRRPHQRNFGHFVGRGGAAGQHALLPGPAAGRGGHRGHLEPAGAGGGPEGGPGRGAQPHAHRPGQG